MYRNDSFGPFNPFLGEYKTVRFSNPEPTCMAKVHLTEE